MQGPVFSDKGAFGVLLPPLLSQAAAETKRKSVQRRPAWNAPLKQPGLGSQNQEGSGLLTICLSGRQTALMPKTLYAVLRVIMPAYRVTEDESIDLNKQIMSSFD